MWIRRSSVTSTAPGLRWRNSGGGAGSTHVLTDNRSCFTQAFAKVCAALRADYRHIKPSTPQTNGMVERFNGRIVSKVLAITVYSQNQLEQLLRGFTAATTLSVSVCLADTTVDAKGVPDTCIHSCDRVLQ